MTPIVLAWWTLCIFLVTGCLAPEKADAIWKLGQVMLCSGMEGWGKWCWKIGYWELDRRKEWEIFQTGIRALLTEWSLLALERDKKNWLVCRVKGTLVRWPEICINGMYDSHVHCVFTWFEKPLQHWWKFLTDSIAIGLEGCRPHSNHRQTWCWKV